MSISLTSLIPAKRATDILLNSNLSFTIISDADDLNLDSVIFTINDIVTTINIVQNSTIDFDFTRSLTDLDYGQLYKCKIIIQDTTSLEFSDSFSFTIEEGIFVNGDFRDYKYYSGTQLLANLLPDTTKARFDRFSNFQQFFNNCGGEAEELDKALIKQLSSYFVSTTNLNDLSLLYKVRLPGTFIFSETLLDDGTLLFESPDISGTVNLTVFDVQPSFNNDLFSFYFNKIPDRITFNTIDFIDTPIVDITNISTDTILVDTELSLEGGIVFVLNDVSKFVRIRENNEFKILSATIKGLSIFNQPISETLTFLQNGESISRKQWKKIDTIEFFDFPGIVSGTFKITRLPSNDSLVSDIFTYVSSVRNEFIKWGLEEGPYGSLFQNYIPLGLDNLDRISVPGDDLIREYEVLDIDNATNLDLISMTVDVFDKKIYGIDNEYLYLFDKYEDYPTGLRILKSGSKDPLTVLELETTDLARTIDGKEVSFKAIQVTFGKKVISYRFKLLKPDGNYVYVRTDGTTTSSLDFSIVARGSSNFSSPNIPLVLTDLGDYYLFLETRYNDGTVDIDIKLIRVLKKAAIIKYKLEKFLGTDVLPIKIVTDFDQKVKILDNQDRLHEVVFHRDNMLINFEDKTIFFNENYNSVDIENG